MQQQIASVKVSESPFFMRPFVERISPPQQIYCARKTFEQHYFVQIPTLNLTLTAFFVDTLFIC
jgi:hypothetical protein